MTENEKYQIIKTLTDTNGNKQTAALKIGCTKRHINRMIAGYKKSGKVFFLHGNHAHQPITTIPDSTKQLVLSLYQTKYYDSNLIHYQELLDEMENIKISAILRKEYILSPKAHRSTKKKVKQALKALKSKAKNKKQQALIQTSILNLEDSHPRHPRWCKWQVLSSKKWKLFSSTFWQIKSSTFAYSSPRTIREDFFS